MTLGVKLDRLQFSIFDTKETKEQAANRNPEAEKGLKIFQIATGEILVGHSLVENPNPRKYAKRTKDGNDIITDNLEALSGTFPKGTDYTVTTVSVAELQEQARLMHIPHDLNVAAARVVKQRQQAQL